MSDNVGRKFSELRTPCFLVDKEKVLNNCERMRTMCKNLAVQLRAQTKTHKTLEIAEMQTGSEKRCIVVSTLPEAHLYADGGFEDILYGYPLTPDKLDECQLLMKKVDKFHVMVDNGHIIKSLEDYKADKKWSVFLKVHCGCKRAGVWWEEERGIVLGQEIDKSEKMDFAGIYAHCGNSYTSDQNNPPVDIAAQSCERIVDFVHRLREAGVKTPIYGIGSTPSCAKSIPEMTQVNELHPGNYTFYDAQQLSLDSCSLDDIACMVATRVVGHYPRRNQLLIDCGFTALTKQGMGELDTGCAIFKDQPQLKLLDMTQELGKVTSKDGTSLEYEKYPIGSLLYIYPWHSCATAALHPVYLVHDGEKIIEQWTPCRGW